MSLARDNWDWNPDGTSPTTPASNTTNNDFRRQEIAAMNAEADSVKMARWGLIGLGVVVVLGMVMQPSRSRK